VTAMGDDAGLDEDAPGDAVRAQLSPNESARELNESDTVVVRMLEVLLYGRIET